MQKGYRDIPKVIHFNNLYTETIVSFYIVYCFLDGRSSHTGVRGFLSNSHREEATSSRFLLFLWSLKYLLVDRCMEKLKGVMRGFLYQMIGIKIFHLILKILLCFRYIALNYIEQMVKYQFGVNLVCCTDDNWTPSLQVQSAGSPCLHHAV